MENEGKYTKICSCTVETIVGVHSVTLVVSMYSLILKHQETLSAL